MVLIFYILFLKYKLRNTHHTIKLSFKVMRVLVWAIVYFVFFVVVSLLAIITKIIGQGVNTVHFFTVFADVLGYISGACSCVVWIPQIYTLIKRKEIGNISPLMFALQTPGNLIIIVFQAIIYKQAVSTWITYLITFVQQLVILSIVVVYCIRDRRKNSEPQYQYNHTSLTDEQIYQEQYIPSYSDKEFT